MKALIQANYEERLSRYATLLHGTEPPGLAAKLGVYACSLSFHWCSEITAITALASAITADPSSG